MGATVNRDARNIPLMIKSCRPEHFLQLLTDHVFVSLEGCS